MGLGKECLEKFLRGNNFFSFEIPCPEPKSMFRILGNLPQHWVNTNAGSQFVFRFSKWGSRSMLCCSHPIFLTCSEAYQPSA